MKTRMEDPEFIKKLKYLLYVSVGIFIILGFFVEFHPHYWWEKVPAFFAMFGFIICMLIIFGAKAIGRLIQRKEDHYD
jgi:protein-S-isoprenylcysteine O-methyltransferase Ste14